MYNGDPLSGHTAEMGTRHRRRGVSNLLDTTEGVEDMSHEAIRYGDEYQCAKCGKTWEVNDPEPPPCKTGGEYLAEIREKLQNVKRSK